jgi:hypothetical protein
VTKKARAKPRAKKKATPKRSRKSAAPSNVETPAPDVIDPALAKRAAKIKEKLRLGQATTEQEVRVLDAIMEGHGPNADVGADAADDEQDAAPEDVLLPSVRKIAEVLGVHHNTLGNWKKKGLEPVGTMPWSLKAFLLILRPANKLTECHPTTDKAKALWKWAFGVRGLGSVNPDDPAHGPTIGWSEERDRQAALKERTARKSAELELDKKRGLYYDADEVRGMLTDLRNDVVGEISSVQTVANQVRGLTPVQRAELADLLMEWQAAAKKRISGNAMTYAATIKGTADVVPG